MTDETERPYGAWLRATGRRTTANMGSQWLVTKLPRAETKVHNRTKVMETTKFAGRQSTRMVGYSERTTGKSTGTGGNISKRPGGNGDKNQTPQVDTVGYVLSLKKVESNGPKNCDPKRKRGSEKDSDGFVCTTMEMECENDELPKTVLEVGPRSQTHLKQ